MLVNIYAPFIEASSLFTYFDVSCLCLLNTIKVQLRADPLSFVCNILLSFDSSVVFSLTFPFSVFRVVLHF